MSVNANLPTLEYDHLLEKVAHYQVYPQMRPWVGKGYPLQSHKLLLVAESHYVGNNFEFHRDPERWYDGVDTGKSEGFWTRQIITNGIKSEWRKKSAALFRNMDSALRASRLFDTCPTNAFTEVAFMNYFQRPAEISGKSIKVSKQDAIVASEVFQGVVGAVGPDAVIFCSSLAYRYASDSGVTTFLDGRNIPYAHAPHAGMPWWYRVAKKYGGKNGKQVFVDFIDQYVANKSNGGR